MRRFTKEERERRLKEGYCQSCWCRAADAPSLDDVYGIYCEGCRKEKREAKYAS